MTPKLILSSEGTLKYVAEWPEEPNKQELFTKKDMDNFIGYPKACKQAIANGIPFKDQTDIQTIEAALNLSGKVLKSTVGKDESLPITRRLGTGNKNRSVFKRLLRTMPRTWMYG